MLEKIRTLGKDLAIYGVGDVATQIVSFLLLPIYFHYLTSTDFGVLALLNLVEIVAKIVYRWGLDGSFMRFYYDTDDERVRQELASTILFFLIAVDGAIVAVAIGLSRWLAPALFGIRGYTLALQLVLLNTFVLSFSFLPYHVMRIMGRAREFSAITFARSAATVVLRLLLVVGFGLGVLGVVESDLIVTIGSTLVLLRWFAPLIRPMFSMRTLRETLRFGLPRLPHGVAQQVMQSGDTAILRVFLPLNEIGIYNIGVRFGTTLKYFLSAFENAWAPTYYAAAREPDAKPLFAAVTTYGVGVLVLLTAGLSATASDLIHLVSPPEYARAAAVIPWIALGVTFQGVYQLTSIGLNLTKRTEYYPLATSIAAVINIGVNLLLIPRWGILGAAFATTLCYAVLAWLGHRFSNRVYPMRYERTRLIELVVAGTAAYVAGRWLVPAMPAIAGVFVRGIVTVVVFAGVLWACGFAEPEEVAVVRRMMRQFTGRAPRDVEPDASALTDEMADVDPERAWVDRDQRTSEREIGR